MKRQVIERAQCANCGDCWQVPGKPCADGYDHLERYLRACRKGLISHAEAQAAVAASLLVTGGSIIVQDVAAQIV